MKKDERNDFLGHEGDNRLSDDQIHTDDIRSCQICGSTLSPDEGNICNDCLDRINAGKETNLIPEDVIQKYKQDGKISDEYINSVKKGLSERFEKQDDSYIDKVIQEEKRQSDHVFPNTPTRQPSSGGGGQSQSSGGGTTQTQTQSQAQTVYVNPASETRTTKTISGKTKPNKTRTTKTTKNNVTRIPISDHVEKIIFYRKGKRYIRYRDTRTNRFIKRPTDIKE